MEELKSLVIIEETLKRGTVFTRLLQEFDSLEIEVGLFGAPDVRMVQASLHQDCWTA